jgi:1-acyl-sn-glycerol-3-phosphate acyltransferase
MKDFNQKIEKSRFFFILLGFIKFILRCFFKTLYRVKVYGNDRVPASGKLILCSNHISYADPVVIAAFFPRNIFFMAKIEIFSNWLFTSFLRYFNAFPVNRKGFGRQAIRHSLDILSHGEIVGIFPEGTRSTDGVIREGQKGIGLIAAMSKADILPIAISGTNMIIQKPRKRLFFPEVKIMYGDVISTLQIILNEDDRQAADLIAERTMEEIKKLYLKINGSG